MKMPDIGASAIKFGSRASAAGADYIAGVKNPRRPWQQSTIAAKDSYVTGVQDSIARGGFEKGVSSVSDGTWAGKAATKGGRNYPTAVKEATGDWQKGVQPYFSALGSLELGPKGPRGSISNYQRSQQVGEMLNRVRVGA